MKKLCSLCLISFKRIGEEICDFWRNKSLFLLSFASKIIVLITLLIQYKLLTPQPKDSPYYIVVIPFLNYLKHHLRSFVMKRRHFSATCLGIRIILWPEMNKLWEVMRTQDGPVPVQNITCKLWFSCLYEQIFCFPAWNRDIYNKTTIAKNRFFKKTVKIICKTSVPAVIFSDV
jgi:hypothetical protein